MFIFFMQKFSYFFHFWYCIFIKTGVYYSLSTTNTAFSNKANNKNINQEEYIL